MVDIALLLLASLTSLGRMIAAYTVSTLLAISIGVAMARRRLVEEVLLPLLDILQSIPVLGFFPVVFTLLLMLPARQVALEAAAVFLLTTGLLWNMIFGVYSAVKSLDPDILLMADVYGLKAFSRLAYIYVPSARAALAANSIISWAGGWFFLTSVEVIASGPQEYRLLGLGSLIMDLYNEGDVWGFYTAILLLFLMIVSSYLLVFNPAVNTVTRRLMLPASGIIFPYIARLASATWGLLLSLGMRLEARRVATRCWMHRGPAAAGVAVALPTVLLLSHGSLANPLFISSFLSNFLISLARVSAITLLSLVASVALAYLALTRQWGVGIAFIGEVLGSIPAIIWWPLLSPLASPLPWLVSLVVFLQGSFWYEFFNIMLFGVPEVREELMELARVYGVKGFNYFRYILLPSLLPSIASGALSAWGGAWNSTIVAEYFSSGILTVDLGGVGSTLARYVYSGNLEAASLTILLWAVMIVVLDKILWSRIFKLVEKTHAVGE